MCCCDGRTSYYLNLAVQFFIDVVNRPTEDGDDQIDIHLALSDFVIILFLGIEKSFR